MDYNVQMVSSIKTLTLVNLGDARAIAKIDSGAISTNVEKYVTENQFSYYVLLNVWAHQIVSNSSEEGWVYIWLRIQQCGLLPVIREASDLADKIIHGEAPDWDYTYGYLGVLANRDYSVCDPKLVELLTILRFPKRFSPKYADIILSDSLAAFLELNTRVKEENKREPSRFILSAVRARVHHMLRNFTYSLDDGYFSSGTTATTTKQLARKLAAYAQTEPNLARCEQFQFSSAPAVYDRWWDSRKLRASVITKAVPKSYKAARIIAKEPVVSAFFLQAIAKGILRTIEKNGYNSLVDVEDQETSQDLCRLGSIDGKYATIDLTSASDTISESFARSVLPYSLIDAAEEFRCAYLEAGGKTRIMQMFATSGSPLTFPVESIIFAAIAAECTDSVARLTRSRLLPPRVYGDDIIIDDRACEYCCDVLLECGFKPNLGKTFFSSSTLGYYRESCGVEYLNGYPMHHTYYPRRPIMANSEGIAALCELQHKLYGNWKVRMFLSQVVLKLEPRMTSHPFGSLCEDLWDQISTGIPVQLRNSDSPYALRFKHLSLKAKYAAPLTADRSRELLDMWYYYCYLKYGPLYEDAYSRLLNVTVSRKKYVADTVSATFNWSYRVE